MAALTACLLPFPRGSLRCTSRASHTGLRTMRTLVSLLVLLVVIQQTRLQRDQDADFDMHTFKGAVRQAYNDSMSFSQNFYELLALICPESVYCQANGTFDTENADFRRNLVIQDATSVPEGLLQNYDQTSIANAQIFLRRNAHHLAGCCVSCSCNDDCRERHNCCPSIAAKGVISEDIESIGIPTQECTYANGKSYLETYEPNFSETIGLSYFMVNDCSSTNVSDDDATKCTYPSPDQQDETTPVYSTDVKRIYKNMFCARCNGISHVTPMSPWITISHVWSLTETYRLPNSPNELYSMAMSNRRFFDIRYTFPSDRLNIQDFGCVKAPASLLPESSTCDVNTNLDQDQIYIFKRACEMKQHLYHTDLYVYKNVFCYLCQWIYPSSMPTCGTYENPYRTPKTSFSVLLTSGRSPSVQPEVTSKDNTLCSCAERFDTSKKRCREILCPSGENRNGCSCVPFITNITGMRIKLDLEINPQLQYSVADERFERITKAMRKLIASQFGPLTSDSQYLFRQSASAGERIPKFHYCEFLTLNGVHDDREGVENMFTTLHAGLTKAIVGTKMKISLGRIIDIGSASNGLITDYEVGSEVELELLYPGRDDFLRTDLYNHRSSQPLKKLVYCERIKLDEDEEERLYNVTAAVGWSRAYLEYVYWQEDGSMCIEDFEAAFMQGNSSGTYSHNIPKNGYWVILVSALAIPCILIAICFGLDRLAARQRLTEQSNEIEMN